jgi:hypothetical protein
MNFLEKARAIRSQLDALITEMTDEQALQSSVLFREWNGDGIVYEIGQRVTYNEILYKVLQSHTSQADWTPDMATSLYTKVLIPDENIIPEWVQPDSTNAYMTGDKVMFEGKTYESLIDNNIWNPIDYPAGWQEV